MLKYGKKYKIKCIDNAGWDDKLTIGKTYEGIFGNWCLSGEHYYKDRFISFCQEHGNHTEIAFKLINDEGQSDVWGYWNFEVIGSSLSVRIYSFFYRFCRGLIRLLYKCSLFIERIERYFHKCIYRIEKKEK